MLHFPTHPDDLPHLFAGLVRSESGHDPFSDDVLAREIFLREALIHDHDWGGLISIALVKNAALANRYSHRLEVIGRDNSNWRRVSLTLRKRTVRFVER